MKFNKKRLSTIRKDPEPVGEVSVPPNMPTSSIDQIPIKNDPKALKKIIKRTKKLMKNESQGGLKGKQWKAWCKVEIAAHEYHLDRLKRKKRQ